ncbi:hypothetical protein Dimus_022494 [Dionaea muscipula]
MESLPYASTKAAISADAATCQKPSRSGLPKIKHQVCFIIHRYYPWSCHARLFKYRRLKSIPTALTLLKEIKAATFKLEVKQSVTSFNKQSGSESSVLRARFGEQHPEGKVGGQGRRARSEGKVGEQGRRARPEGKVGGQGRRARPEGKAGGQGRRARSESKVGEQGRRARPEGKVGEQGRSTRPEGKVGAQDRRARFPSKAP